MHVPPIALFVAASLLAVGCATRAPITWACFASFAFGSTAIVSLPAFSGTTVPLYIPLLGLLIIAAVFRRTFWVDLLRVFGLHYTPYLVLLLLLWGTGSALILPRLLEGVTTVFVPSRGAILETSLRPVSGNINQLIYFTVGILAFFSLAGRFARDGRFEILRIGFFAFSSVHAALGLIDIAGKSSGAGDLLAPFRTAGYSMLVEVQVEGFWRIAGGYPEASSFAGATIVALAFTFSYWRATGWWPALCLSAILLPLLMLSTSSTGYASLAILGFLLALSWFWRLLRGRMSGRDLMSIVAAAVAVVFVLAVLVLDESSLKPIQRLIEETLINKSTTASADERFYWNARSWRAFLDTYGLGVGLGSSRASSSVIAVLSQLGVVGAFLILLLLADMARPIPKPAPNSESRELAALCNSLRTTGFAAMIPSAIAGGGADPGVVFFIALAGLVSGRVRLRQMRAAHSFRQPEARVAGPQEPVGRPLTGRRPLVVPPGGATAV